MSRDIKMNKRVIKKINIKKNVWSHISAIYLSDTYVNISDGKVDSPYDYVDLSDSLVFQIMGVSRREVDLLPTSDVNFSDKLVNIII